MYLGEIKRWVSWADGRMELLLSPLDSVDDQAIRNSCLVPVREQLPGDEPGNPTGPVIRSDIDYPRRQQLVGQKCIHGWRGPGTPKDFKSGQPIACDAAGIDAFMLVPPAADFVFLQVQSLSLYLEEETQAAGKGYGASSSGVAATGPARSAMRFLRGWFPWRASTPSR